MRRLLAALLWTGGTAGAAWALTLLGRLQWLRVDWADPLGWLRGAEVEVALAVLAWLAGWAVVGWLALSTLVYALARLVGVEGRRVDWLSIGPVRRAVDALLAGSIMLGTVAPAVAAVDPHPVTSEPVTAVDPAYIPVPAGAAPAGPEPQPPPADAPDPPPSSGASVTDSIVVVEPGDHLWKLARLRLEEGLGRPATDGEIAPYWLAVVKENRHRIRSGDPDLIFPGEEIVLPPIADGR